MKRMEAILWSLAILGEVLSLIPVTGGLVLFTLMMLMLMVFYFACSAFLLNNIKTRDIFKKEAYRNIPQSHIFIASGLGPVLFLVCIGILSKMLRFPVALIFLLLPVILSLPILIVSIIKLVRKKHISFYKGIIIRAGILSIVCICLLRTPGLFFSKIKYRNYPAYMDVANQLSADPHNRELMQREQDEEDKINRQKIQR